MWFDGIRQPNTIYAASVSRGKDSTAMLRAIQLMGWPLDVICSVDIWFDETTPAELPPMVAFKDEWDRKCLKWFGVPVTRLCARKRETQDDGDCHSRETYTSYFCRRREKGQFCGSVIGFPMQRGSWCKKLKTEEVDIYGHLLSSNQQERVEKAGTKEQKLYGDTRISGAGMQLVQRRTQKKPFRTRPDKAQKINIVHYIGIAADEPLRIARHIEKPDKVLPLVQIGWDEALCGLEAQYMDMLSPTYTTSMRDGCWFCHNQGVAQLRNLRKSYPDLWEKLLALDNDSPVTFHADGHTVHDFDRRFQCEDEGIIFADERFKWADIEQPQMRLF